MLVEGFPLGSSIQPLLHQQIVPKINPVLIHLGKLEVPTSIFLLEVGWNTDLVRSLLEDLQRMSLRDFPKPKLFLNQV
uniref:Uncharacterized protein MANES_07G106100 n=1 Tax=Rhizophora mucronata TaxID=61149 RepID=A0A2P2P1V8_RHIMU